MLLGVEVFHYPGSSRGSCFQSQDVLAEQEGACAPCSWWALPPIEQEKKSMCLSERSLYYAMSVNKKGVKCIQAWCNRFYWSVI